MDVGYARTSTIEQKAGLATQIDELRRIGCSEIFEEQVSSVQRREQLEHALKFIRKGDTLVVTKLDRLARSVSDLVKILERLRERGAELRILSMSLDTNTPTGRLLINLVGSIAQFEREIMLERQREGVARAKAEGKYKGRAPTARSKADLVHDLASKGVQPTEAAKRLGISRASVYRILAEKSLGPSSSRAPGSSRAVD